MNLELLNQICDYVNVDQNIREHLTSNFTKMDILKNSLIVTDYRLLCELELILHFYNRRIFKKLIFKKNSDSIMEFKFNKYGKIKSYIVESPTSGYEAKFKYTNDLTVSIVSDSEYNCNAHDGDHMYDFNSVGMYSYVFGYDMFFKKVDNVWTVKYMDGKLCQ